MSMISDFYVIYSNSKSRYTELTTRPQHTPVGQQIKHKETQLMQEMTTRGMSYKVLWCHSLLFMTARGINGTSHNKSKSNMCINTFVVLTVHWWFTGWSKSLVSILDLKHNWSTESMSFTPSLFEDICHESVKKKDNHMSTKRGSN